MQVAHRLYIPYNDMEIMIRHENDAGEWDYWVFKNEPLTSRPNVIDSVIHGANVDGLAVLSTVTVMDANLGLIGRIMQAANNNAAVKCVVIGYPPIPAVVTSSPLNPPDETEQPKYFVGEGGGGKHTFTFYSELPNSFTLTAAGTVRASKFPYASTTTSIYYKSGSTMPIAFKNAPVMHGSPVYIDGGWRISGNRSAADKHFRVYNSKDEIAFTAHDVPSVGAWSYNTQLTRNGDLRTNAENDSRNDSVYVRKNANIRLTADFANSALSQGYKNYGDRPIGIYDNGSLAYGSDKPQNASNHIPFKIIQ